MGKSPTSLVDFVKAKKRAACPVCQLPEEVRAQLKEARSKKITRSVQLEWLRDEVGVEIDDLDLNSHIAGRHES